MSEMRETLAELLGEHFGYSTVIDHTAHKAVDALLAALWQPIETAPRDGTDLVLCSDQSQAADVGSWERDGWTMNGSGWEPTHWMPMPEFPEDWRSEMIHFGV